MRKVIFTEEQLKYIMGEGATAYLPKSGEAGEIPGNAYGTQIFANNLDKDAPDDATIPDKITNNKARRSYYGNRSMIGYPGAIYESDNDDNVVRFTKKQVQGFKNAEGNGKMLNNLAKEKSSRHNTNQVRLSRLEKQKKENPQQYIGNGGKATEKALKSAVSKENNKNAVAGKESKEINPLTITPDVNRGTSKGTNNKNVIYYY